MDKLLLDILKPQSVISADTSYQIVKKQISNMLITMSKSREMLLECNDFLVDLLSHMEK